MNAVKIYLFAYGYGYIHNNTDTYHYGDTIIHGVDIKMEPDNVHRNSPVFGTPAYSELTKFTRNFLKFENDTHNHAFVFSYI